MLRVIEGVMMMVKRRRNGDVVGKRVIGIHTRRACGMTSTVIASRSTSSSSVRQAGHGRVNEARIIIIIITVRTRERIRMINETLITKSFMINIVSSGRVSRLGVVVSGRKRVSIFIGGVERITGRFPR